MRIEVRICRRCQKAYFWKGGWIVVSPKNIDSGLCSKCKRHDKIGLIYRNK